MIIVDTSGRHRQEQALFDEMKQVTAAVQPDEIIFVMDSHIGQACYDQALAFSNSVAVGSVIITKLDGHAKGGGALSAVAATGAPVTFIGSGEHLEELEKFEPRGFVGRLMGLGDISGLVDTIKGAVNIEEQKEMMQRMQQGRFSMRDFYGQLQSVLKMGPLGKVMSMMPGMGGQTLPDGMEQLGVQRLKRFIVIMDSLTSEELDSSKPILNESSRLLRISRGSGSRPEQVIEMLEEYKRFQKIIEKMGKTGLMGKAGDLSNMQRNPGQVMKKLQQSMDPQLLAQWGGTQNLFNMMKELESNEEMSGLMKQMQSGGSGSKKRK